MKFRAAVKVLSDRAILWIGGGLLFLALLGAVVFLLWQERKQTKWGLLYTQWVVESSKPGSWLNINFKGPSQPGYVILALWESSEGRERARGHGAWPGETLEPAVINNETGWAVVGDSPGTFSSEGSGIRRSGFALTTGQRFGSVGNLKGSQLNDLDISVVLLKIAVKTRDKNDESPYPYYSSVLEQGAGRKYEYPAWAFELCKLSDEGNLAVKDVEAWLKENASEHIECVCYTTTPIVNKSNNWLIGTPENDSWLWKLKIKFHNLRNAK